MNDAYQQKWAIGAQATGITGVAGGGFQFTIQIAAAGVTQVVATPKVATLGFRVQRLRLVVTTGSAGKTVTFASTATAVPLSGAIALDNANTVINFDYGPKGVTIPAGETITATISAAGAAFTTELEGYYR